jgi:hypothetical protein
MRLIRRWLRVSILLDGKLVKRRRGVPQGSPLSPLLSNIMLHELDMEMERRKLRFVRYADDFFTRFFVVFIGVHDLAITRFSICCKTESEARKIGNSIFLYLRDKLKLPINREKSGIRRPLTFKILGYGFVSTYRKGEKGKYQLVVEDKRWKTLKVKLKEITRKTTPLSFDQRMQKLKEVQRGWINYFKYASIFNKLNELDGWLRNRIRYYIWTDWKGETLRKCPVDIFSYEPARSAGAKAEKPDKAWSRFGSCLSMEQDGQLGNCPKPNSEHHHHGSRTNPTRL